MINLCSQNYLEFLNHISEAIILSKEKNEEHYRKSNGNRKMRKLQRVLIFCVEFRELSYLTRDLSPAEKKVTVVTS